ncbi:MAG: Fic family protein [Hyphomicrobiales bacterium]|nr:Fic family protein [Hyphomicrobiales bacterium]
MNPAKNQDKVKPKGTTEDAGEQLSLMEPTLISESSRQRGGLLELAFELGARAAGFRRSLPTGLLTALSDLVRSMNCYYSNLIEGHDTHPVDIERALNNDFSSDPAKRDLQLEAKAHIAVQRWIDQGGLGGPAATVASVSEIHRRFGEALPDDLLWAENPQTKQRERVIPGAFRQSYVQVGRHVAVSPGAVPRFLARYEAVFSRLGRAESVLAAAAAHHRLLWIHPFPEMNGRVARLVSHATLLDALNTGGVWSIARGLARRDTDYKAHLGNCDLQRRNDLDGRGNLSEETLADFTRFFLEVCLDQVEFMESLMQPDRLRLRILGWAAEEEKLGTLPAKAGKVLEAMLYRGELSRADIPELLGVQTRQTRRILSALHGYGVIASPSSRAPWRLAFPATLAPRWMPGLFPERR